MHKKIAIPCLILAIFVFASCKQTKKEQFHISANYTHADQPANAMPGQKVNKVTLVEVSFGKEQAPITLDSATISGANGEFNLSAIGKAQSLYELIFGDNLQPIPLINDAAEIKLSIDLSKKDDYYEISGSPASTQLRDLISSLGKKNFAIEKAYANMDTLKAHNAPDSVLASASTAKDLAIQDLNSFLSGFINNSSNATLGILALNWSSRSFSMTEFENSMNVLIQKYPDNPVLASMKKNYILQKEAAAKAQGDNNWVNKQAPDLVLPDANGNNISLASFKGKYVLVDFWASWCGPCRMENPNVVAAYQKFKQKNFAILGVSLDKDKQPWLDAVAQDKLDWTQVSDLKEWNTKAVSIFKFNGIPFNVLIDPSGKIIGQELRGQDLIDKLTSVLK